MDETGTKVGDYTDMIVTILSPVIAVLSIMVPLIFMHISLSWIEIVVKVTRTFSPSYLYYYRGFIYIYDLVAFTLVCICMFVLGQPVYYMLITLVSVVVVVCLYTHAARKLWRLFHETKAHHRLEDQVWMGLMERVRVVMLWLMTTLLVFLIAGSLCLHGFLEGETRTVSFSIGYHVFYTCILVAATVVSQHCRARYVDLV